MAGSIFWQELVSSSLFTISTSAGTITNNSSLSYGNIDCRSGGTSGLVEKFVARFDLQVQWFASTGIQAQTNCGDLFLVPSLDGTNFPNTDLSTTPGTSTGVGSVHYVGSFIGNVVPVVSTNVLINGPEVDLYARLYQVVLTNRSGQTMQNASGSVRIRVTADQIQYT